MPLRTCRARPRPHLRVPCSSTRFEPDALRYALKCCLPQSSIALGAAVGLYYVLRIPGGAGILTHTLHEYVSFIALIGSLFVVAGGIHIKVRGEATPLCAMPALDTRGLAP